MSKDIVEEETVGKVNKQELTKEMLNKEDDPEMGKHGSNGRKRSYRGFLGGNNLNSTKTSLRM